MSGETHQPADGERYYIGADTLQKLIDDCGPYILHDDEDTARDLRMALLELQENQAALAAAAEQLREANAAMERLKAESDFRFQMQAQRDEARSRIAALEADNARLHKFKNYAARILHSLTSGVIRVMEEQLDQSRKVAAQMAKEIEDFTQEPPNAK